MSYRPVILEREDRYKVKVEEYVGFRRDGFLRVKKLLAEKDVQRLSQWSGDVLYGRELWPGSKPVSENATLNDYLKRFDERGRVHMLHLLSPTAEWGLLHPRVLDVVSALIGPDVLALQTMLFFNPPGRGGQGWHQDSYYIPTHPDTLIGAWIALDNVDEDNGCLWVVPGSHHEPIYPPSAEGAPIMHAEGAFKDLVGVDHVSDLDDERNTLSRIAGKYAAPIPVRMNAGDVLFFHSHLLHRSYPNRTQDRWRRAFVNHYCNARSWVPWMGKSNDSHLLVRGSTHLGFARPKFGTQVDIRQDEPGKDTSALSMMGMEDGNMEPVIVENPESEK